MKTLANALAMLLLTVLSASAQTFLVVYETDMDGQFCESEGKVIPSDYSRADALGFWTAVQKNEYSSPAREYYYDDYDLDNNEIYDVLYDTAPESYEDYDFDITVEETSSKEDSPRSRARLLKPGKSKNVEIARLPDGTFLVTSK